MYDRHPDATVRTGVRVPIGRLGVQVTESGSTAVHLSAANAGYRAAKARHAVRAVRGGS